MTKIDNDPEIKDLSRLLWERAGRPTGREHVYWALASKEFDNENDTPERRVRSIAR